MTPTVDQLAHQYLDRISALDPTEASGWGALGHDRELTDQGPDAEGSRAALARETLAALTLAAVDSHRDQIAASAMRDRLQVRLEQHEAGEWMRSLHLFGPLNSTRRVFDLMARSSEEEWEGIAERMTKVPNTLASIRATLETGISRGITSSRRQVLVSAAQARTFGGDGPRPGYFRQLAAGYLVPADPLGRRLAEMAAAADRAYLDMAAYLESGYLSAAVEGDGVGEDLYQLQCRAFNGVTIEAATTYTWGWEELARIEAEMRATAGRILPGSSVSETIELLEDDPSRGIEGAESFRRWNQGFLEQTVAELQGRHFDIPEPVCRVEAMLAPAGAGPAMYYTPPASDFSRPGRTWYPTMGRTKFPLWAEVATAYHEGVPGHHLQIGHAYWLGDRLNPFQSQLGHVSGHVEGWALYAERLMGELGYLDNPDYYLGMLANQAFRAARVVVDIGLHLHLTLPAGQPFHPGEAWSFALAVEFMSLKSGRSVDFCHGEVQRYLGMPAQAISYKLGERVWLETRAAVQRQLGGGFDLKAFHRRALDLGFVGLEQLRQEMTRPGTETEAAPG